MPGLAFDLTLLAVAPRPLRPRWPYPDDAHWRPYLEPGMDALVLGDDPGPLRAIAREALPGLATNARGLSACRLASFGFAFARGVLAHVEDPVAVLREIRSALRPGGRIVLVDADAAVGEMEPTPPAVRSLVWLLSRRMRLRGGQAQAGRRLAQWATEAGFEDVCVELRSAARTGGAFYEAAEALRGLAENPRAFLFERTYVVSARRARAPW